MADQQLVEVPLGQLLRMYGKDQTWRVRFVHGPGGMRLAGIQIPAASSEQETK